MRDFIAVMAGFFTLFDFYLYFMILLFFWPHMLPDIADGQYEYMAQVKFILAGGGLIGLLGGFTGLFVDSIE